MNHEQEILDQQISDNEDAFYQDYQRHQEYCFKYFDVKCVSCGETARESQFGLQRAGWTLDKQGEWCPHCTDQHVNSDTPFSAKADSEEIVF